MMRIGRLALTLAPKRGSRKTELRHADELRVGDRVLVEVVVRERKSASGGDRQHVHVSVDRGSRWADLGGWTWGWRMRDEDEPMFEVIKP